MKAKHTQGDWNITGEGKTLLLVGDRHKGTDGFEAETIIAQIEPRKSDLHTLENWMANIKLIKSAPALFEALQEIVESLPIGSKAEIIAKQAIKQATE